MESKIPYLFWLSSLYSISHEKRRRACELAGGAEKVFRMTRDQLARTHLFSEKETACILKAQRECSPEEMWQRFESASAKNGIRFVPYDSRDYAERLRHIYNAPCAIYVKGTLPARERMSVAVVGARNCSEYGRSMARKLGCVLAEHGVQVVSGMAVGIDSASHAGALSAGGDTFAVLGSGCDICYPSSSRNIYENILAGNGGIISELPPGTHPQPWFFPMRNRIISALADILIVVEARERSGSLITADLALEQGKDVYAVPGRCMDALSVGCNRLIGQGAGIIVDVDSFLHSAGIVADGAKAEKKPAPPSLSEKENRVLACLELNPKYIDAIARDSGMNLIAVLDALDGLKRKKLARETFQNYFCKII